MQRKWVYVVFFFFSQSLPLSVPVRPPVCMSVCLFVRLTLPLPRRATQGRA